MRGLSVVPSGDETSPRTDRNTVRHAVAGGPQGPPASAGAAARDGDDRSTDRLATSLNRCARGDQQAFEDVYDACAPRVLGIAVAVLRDRAQAEEVAQEVMVEVWRTAARFDPARGSALGWVLTMAHRRSVDRVRSAEASSRRDHGYHARTQDPAFDSTAETATDNLEAQRVQRALDRLTPVQREAVHLAYYGGYTHTEVAGLLDLPVGTAKTRIRDGLIRLRDTLGSVT